MKLTLRSIGVWLLFVVIAFLNGAFREIVMIKKLDIAAALANQLSCLTGIILWTTLLLMLWRKLEIKSIKRAAAVGAGWFITTALFETFIIDRNLTWPEIRQTYNIPAGEYWGLVLAWVGLLPIALFSIFNFRHYIKNWGASVEEQRAPVYGEEFLSSPQISSTQALTVDTIPEKIWPWLIQMGQGRGGFYSYAWLENLVGCKIHNATQIIPELQDLKRGDSISLHSRAPNLKVTVFEINQTLAFEGWIFHLEKIGSNKTRLISRTYTENKPEMGYLYNFIMKSFLYDLAHFIMGRKQLLTIKNLCESR